MYSITLQTTENIVTSGSRIGQLQYAASNEADGSAAILVAGSVYTQAEGVFTDVKNPTSIVLATAAADASAATARLKVTDKGHWIPVTNDLSDLGDSNLKFRNAYMSEGIVLTARLTPSDTTNKLYNEGGTLKFDGSAVGGGGVGGAGTTNSIPLWTASDTLGDSIMVEIGALIGINEATPGAQLEVVSPAAGTVGAIVKAAASQTADIFQVVDSSDAELFAIEDDGQVIIGPAADAITIRADNGSVSQMYSANDNLYLGTDSNTRIQMNKAADRIEFRQASSNYPLRIGLGGVSITGSGNTGFNPEASLHVKAGDLVQSTSIFQALTSQTLPLMEFQDSSSTQVAIVSEIGSVSGLRSNFEAVDIRTADNADVVRMNIAFGSTLNCTPIKGDVNQYLWQGNGTNRFSKIRINTTDVRYEYGSFIKEVWFKTNRASSDGIFRFRVGDGSASNEALTLYDPYGSNAREAHIFSGEGLLVASGLDCSNVILNEYEPPTAALKEQRVYSSGNQLAFNASGIPYSEPSGTLVGGAASGVYNILIINSGAYADLNPVDPETLYFIVS